MYFAIGIFSMLMCLFVRNGFQDYLYSNPKGSLILEIIFGASFTAAFISLMHFGLFNML